MEEISADEFYAMLSIAEVRALLDRECMEREHGLGPPKGSGDIRSQRAMPKRAWTAPPQPSIG